MSKGQIIIQDEEESTTSTPLKSNQVIECSECGESFSNTIDLYEHSKVHKTTCNESLEGYNLECDECQMLLETLEDFGAHMSQVHKVVGKRSVKPIKCHWCGERFVRIQGLYSHIRFAHQFNKDQTKSPTATRKQTTTKQNSCLCTICGKFLSTPVALSTHLLIHSNNKMFKCNVCSASFR